MSSAFDAYNTSYNQVVQDSIAFSGLKHDFFLAAKVRMLETLFQQHFGDVRPTLADIGCGVGAMHPMLTPITARLSGCDPSTDCITRARADNPAVAYANSEGTALPFGTASHDAALAVCVYHHVPVADRAALVSEMRRIVRPGGLVVIIEHNPFNPLTRLAVARCPFDHDAILLSGRESRALLRGSGLDRVSTANFLFLPSANALAQRAERLLRPIPLGGQYISWGIV